MFKQGMDRQEKQHDGASLQTDVGMPKLAKRSLQKKSTIMSGRTIGARRERLETANERIAARKKDKRKSVYRFVTAVACFLVLICVLFFLYRAFIGLDENNNSYSESPEQLLIHDPTIEIIDEDAGSTGGKITSRMKEYISRVEECLRGRGYQPQNVVIPSSGVREIRVNLEGYSGFIKMIIDRDPAISVEDADRMLRYLKERGITDFAYIDVRIDGKAYWK